MQKGKCFGFLLFIGDSCNLIFLLFYVIFLQEGRLWKVLFLVVSMKSVMHFFGNTSSLEYWWPVISNTNLIRVKVEKLQEKFLEEAEIKGCLKVFISRLLKDIVFLPTLQSLELLQYCLNHYDIKSKSILSKNGEPLLSITRYTISFVLKLCKSPFASFNSTQSLVQFWEDPLKNHN